MLPTLLVLGYFSGFTVPGFCCRAKEYLTRGGQCCPMCPEGKVVEIDCTELFGTRCRPCGTGTFMNQPSGLNECFRCSSCVPGNGLFVQQPCTETKDTVCDVVTGYFCNSWAGDTGCSLAEKHSLCTPGQKIKEPGTNRTDTTCEDCQPGYFSQEGLTCMAWKICSEGKVKEGSPSTDVVCRTSLGNQDVLFSPLLVFVLHFCL